MKNIKLEDLIVLDHDDYLVLNKPPFISSLRDRSGEIDISQIVNKELPEAQLCHRLDKETSGCLIVAKNADAYREASMLFEERLVSKFYLAICEGVHDFQEKEIDAPLYIKKKGEATVDFHNGKESNTIVNTGKVYRGYTLVQAMPITGRLHQIRVHLSYVGAPITGDTRYGGKAFFLSNLKRGYKHGREKEERPLINRVALHSFRVAFNRPNGEEIFAEAPYPKDFKVVLRQLEKRGN